MEGITFSAEAITIIDYLCNKFGIAIDWANTNIIPKLQEIAQHIVLWKHNTSIFGAICGGICFILGIVFLSIGIKRNRAYWNGDNKLDGVALMVIGTIFLIVAIPLTVSMVLKIIECNVFPEKTLIDYLVRLKSQYGG